MNYERVAATLQQRFAEQVSRYEGDIALLREEATTAIEQVTFERDEANRKIEELEAKIAELEEAAEGRSAQQKPAELDFEA